MAQVLICLGAMALLYALVDRILKFKERKKNESNNSTGTDGVSK